MITFAPRPANLEEMARPMLRPIPSPVIACRKARALSTLTYPIR